MKYAIYRLDTGEIISLISCPEFCLDANVPDGCSAIPFDETVPSRVNLETHTAEPKPQLPVSDTTYEIPADGETTALITTLPGTIAVFDGQPHNLPTGELHFAVDLPGTYQITLQHPLHLDTTVEITAV